jgi:TP901-1 family phage major tail protein
MAEIVNGTKILIKLNLGGTEKLLAGQMSATHDVTVDAIETTHKLSTGGAKTYIAGEHTITYKVDCVVDPNDTTNATYSDVYAALKAKAEVDYTYGGITTGDKKYSGKAIITGLSQSAPQNDKVTFSIDLQVTGDETEGTVV